MDIMIKKHPDIHLKILIFCAANDFIEYFQQISIYVIYARYVHTL